MSIVDIVNYIILLFVLFNAVVLSTLFISIDSQNKKANIFFSSYLFCIVIDTLNDSLSELSSLEIINKWIFIIEPFLFVLPFLFLYVLEVLNEKIEYKYYLLFIPGVIHNILLHSDGFIFTDKTITNYETIVYILEILLIIYAYKLVQNHKEKSNFSQSKLQFKTFKWLSNILLLNILIHFFSISTFVVDLSHIAIIENSIDILALGLTVFLIFWISYNGFSNSEIFKQSLTLSIENNIDIANVHLSHNSHKGDKDLKQIERNEYIKNKELSSSKTDIQKFEKIKQKILIEELYTEPKLNLRSLSIALGLKEKEISRLINECGKVNFYEFINQYRIDKFKQLLSSSEAQYFTLLGLAFEAGFSSKSSFYLAFKKMEGMTPKQFKMLMNKS